MTSYGLMFFFVTTIFIKLLGNVSETYPPQFVKALALSLPDRSSNNVDVTLLGDKVVHFSMGIGVSKAYVTQDVAELNKLVQELIDRDKIVIFSKTYCPYCKMAKQYFCHQLLDDVKECCLQLISSSNKPELYVNAPGGNNVFDSLNRKYTVIELDKREDGSAIQAILGQMTGVRTVPRVFIDGKCVGGGNEIKNLFESGTLITMLK